MKLEITMDLDNAAFAGEDQVPEIVACLDRLGRSFTGHAHWNADDAVRVRDSNGNTVGVATFLAENE